MDCIYEDDKHLAILILKNYCDDGETKKYMTILQKVANREVLCINIDLDDCIKPLYVNDVQLDTHMLGEFTKRVIQDTRRYLDVFADAIDELMPKPEPYTYGHHDKFLEPIKEGQKMPPKMKRHYEIYIRPLSEGKPFTIREVKASYSGHLVRICGIVMQCSDVKPLMQFALYICEECHSLAYQEGNAQVFMPMSKCPCQGNLIPLPSASKFLNFQEAKIQELAEHVPKGHNPRKMTVHFRGELTRKVAPGDVVDLSGILLLVVHSGSIADMYLEAMSVTCCEKDHEVNNVIEFSEDESRQITQLLSASTEERYNMLAHSLAPEIYAHEDIKKALLLFLVGAQRKLQDGMKIRGDLHMCLMGGPAVAKRQLLKHILNLAPRGIYTTGSGRSGAGLTAAVRKDPVTNEMVLEGGALVLSDMGVCAIDEFDKINEVDHTKIHEVMEQQTVSIAMAGITTSLNARTAILAAVNWGEYNRHVTEAEYNNLNHDLLSRFDLLLLMRDQSDKYIDYEVAKHVLYVHNNEESPTSDQLSPSVIRHYISEARKCSPSVPPGLQKFIVDAYFIQQKAAINHVPLYDTTFRTLLSILRMSIARARLRLSDIVSKSDVLESFRLMGMSKLTLLREIYIWAYEPMLDIYTWLVGQGSRFLRFEDALMLASLKGYNEAQLKECLEVYSREKLLKYDRDSFDIKLFLNQTEKW